jgi:Ca2+-binding RTX toxin-like protein
VVGTGFVVNDDAFWQLGTALAFGAGGYTFAFNSPVILDNTGQFTFIDIYGERITPIPSATLTAQGGVVVTGSLAADTIVLSQSGTNLRIDYGSALTQTYPLASVKSIYVASGVGDDLVTIKGLFPSTRVDGGDGNDKIFGGDGDELLIGGAQKDFIDGGLGNDRLNGNGGNDRLFGNAGADRLYGYDGNDYLDGGPSNDRLEGGGGADTSVGQKGDDRFFARDGEVDTLYGSLGTDTALVDKADILSTIETVSTA